MGQTAIGFNYFGDDASAVYSEPTDDDSLENWMPVLEDRQQPVSCDCDDFLDGESDDFVNTRNVNWDNSEIDDDSSENSFAVETRQPYRSLQQLLEQVNSRPVCFMQQVKTRLFHAADTNESDIDRGDITDLETNKSDEDESSFFSISFFDKKTVEEDAEKPRSKSRRID